MHDCFSQSGAYISLDWANADLTDAATTAERRELIKAGVIQTKRTDAAVMVKLDLLALVEYLKHQPAELSRFSQFLFSVCHDNDMEMDDV
jgi:hypothetical protein